MFAKIIDFRKKEGAFSLLELSVAVGVAAILAVSGILASTAFIGSVQEKSIDYTANASSSIKDAEAQSLALYGGFYGEGVNPLLNFAYAGVANGRLSFTRGLSLQSFLPNSVYTGASYSIASGTLPAGVILNPTTGALTGPADWGFNTTQAGGTGSDIVTAVTKVNSGTVLVGRLPVGNTTFGSTTLTSAGGTDIFVAKVNNKGDYVWAKQAGGTSSDSAQAVTATSDGGVIVGGYINGSVTFGTTTLLSDFGRGFLIKLDSNGNYVWVRQTPASVHSLEVDSVGNIVMSGTKFSSAGAATFGATVLPASTSNYVAKMSSNGDWLWANEITLSNFYFLDAGFRLALTKDGGAIISGMMHGGNAVVPGLTTLVLAGGEDAFIAKVGPDGLWEWAKNLGGTGFEGSHSATATAEGGAIVTGYFSSANLSLGGETISPAGGLDAFIMKLDGEGNVVWLKRGGGTSSDFGTNAIETPTEEILQTGYFQGTAVFVGNSLISAGSNDVFVAKLDKDGNYIWATRTGGTGNDQVLASTLTPDGGMLISGRFTGSGTFGASSITSVGNNDIFSVKVNANGSWAPAALSDFNETVTINIVSAEETYEYTVSLSSQ